MVADFAYVLKAGLSWFVVGPSWSMWFIIWIYGGLGA